MKQACVTEEHLRNYLPCYVWGIQDPVRISTVPLSDIGMTRPPQSWQYLTDEQADILERRGVNELHLSRALVEEYLEASCSDSAPSAPSSSNPGPQAYCSPDRMTDYSRLSRFGMTYAPLTDDMWRGLVDVVSGGFPCQDISAAGKGAGIDGARSGL